MSIKKIKVTISITGEDQGDIKSHLSMVRDQINTLLKQGKDTDQPIEVEGMKSSHTFSIEYLKD